MKNPSQLQSKRTESAVLLGAELDDMKAVAGLADRVMRVLKGRSA